MSGTLNGQGPDQCWKSCGFTNSESDAATKNMLSLVDIFRQCPVLKTISRFDGICDLNDDDRCNTKFGYGLLTTIYFYFKSCHCVNGKKYNVFTNQLSSDLKSIWLIRFAEIGSRSSFTAMCITKQILLLMRKVWIMQLLRFESCLTCQV